MSYSNHGNLTGLAQGKGGVQSQDSHAMVQEYFVFVCHPYIMLSDFDPF